MTDYCYVLATEVDLPFIVETYNENIEALHGVIRSYDTWKSLIAEEQASYYIVHAEEPVAWFRIDKEGEDTQILWLGMLQVHPKYQYQGVGKYILNVFEELAKKDGFKQLGIHTTDDNIAAKNLYLSYGYEVTEYGECTTADGKERMGYTLHKNIQ